MMKPMKSRGHGGQDEMALERLVFFSDAVFAIAITLLALEIRVPEVDAHDPAALSRAVLGLWPNLLAYTISFLFVGSYWMAHHRIFHAIERYDTGLIRLNLLFLLGVALLPFPCGLLARYGDLRFAVLCYATFLALLGLVLALLWVYATWHRHLVARDLPTALVRATLWRQLGSAGIFALSLGLAFINPYLAEASWLGIFLFRPVAAHLGTEQGGDLTR